MSALQGCQNHEKIEIELSCIRNAHFRRGARWCQLKKMPEVEYANFQKVVSRCSERRIFTTIVWYHCLESDFGIRFLVPSRRLWKLSSRVHEMLISKGNLRRTTWNHLVKRDRGRCWDIDKNHINHRKTTLQYKVVKKVRKYRNWAVVGTKRWLSLKTRLSLQRGTTSAAPK